MVEKLKTGLAQMKDKLGELKSNRDQLVARSEVAEAQDQSRTRSSSIDILDPTSEVSRFEEKVRREEARAPARPRSRRRRWTRSSRSSRATAPPPR